MEATLTLVEKTVLLKEFSVFSTIPTEALAQLAARAKEEHFEAGELVIREGEPNRGVFLVVEGQLEVRKGGQFSRIIDAGMGFGQLELLEGDPHTLSVSALHHTHVLFISYEELMDSIMEFPDIGIGIMRLLAIRVQELVDRVLALDREMSTLVDRLRKAGVALPGEDREMLGAGTPPGDGAS